MVPRASGQGKMPHPLAAELQKHLSGTVKQFSQKMNQFQQQSNQARPISNESDELVLMAAKGAATLKQQKSTSNVMTSHPQGVMPQSDLELPQTKSIFKTSFNENT